MNNVEENGQLVVNEGNQINKIIRTRDYEDTISKLTDDQKPYYIKLTDGISIRDANSVNRFGSDLNKIISNDGDELLSKVRSGHDNELIKLTDELLYEIKDVDVSAFDTKSSKLYSILKNLPILGRLVKTVEINKIKFDSVSNKVIKIGDKFKDAKSVAIKNNTSLQEIFDSNIEYIDKIQEYIIGGKLKIKELEEGLAIMERNPENHEPYEISETQSLLQLLKKKVSDMITMEYAHRQNLLQIKAVQANNMTVVYECDNVINNVIPQWKSQVALSLSMSDQEKSQNAISKAHETTQQILKKNSEVLKHNTIELARMSESTIIDVDTLEKTSRDLIECINEVKRIRSQGETNRELLESKLKSISQGMYNALQLT